jgi:hypothetical protein
MPQHDMLHTVLQTIFSPKFKQIFDIYTRHAPHPPAYRRAGIEKLKTKIKIRIDFICLGQKILKHDEKMVMILIFKFS